MIKAMPTHKPSLLYYWILTGQSYVHRKFLEKASL
jgi:hypothetical protein